MNNKTIKKRKKKNSIAFLWLGQPSRHLLDVRIKNTRQMEED
jgi:hypothetical protein